MASDSDGSPDRHGPVRYRATVMVTVTVTVPGRLQPRRARARSRAGKARRRAGTLAALNLVGRRGGPAAPAAASRGAIAAGRGAAAAPAVLLRQPELQPEACRQLHIEARPGPCSTTVWPAIDS